MWRRVLLILIMIFPLKTFASPFPDSYLVIINPINDQAFQLDDNQWTEASEKLFAITLFMDTTTQVWDTVETWTTELYYATSGGKGKFKQTQSTIKPLGHAACITMGSWGGSPLPSTGYCSLLMETFQFGGRLSVTLTESQTPIQYAFVLGPKEGIPDVEISARLYDLYNTGATPMLLTGIAMRESSYRQFAPQTLFGKEGMWPLESYDGGSHVGLMQVPLTQMDAWNWLHNTNTGAQVFFNKLRVASRLEKLIRQKHHGLRKLTGSELEDIALVLYGPYGKVGLDGQYYMVETNGHHPVWVENLKNNQEGVNYAKQIRDLAR